MRKRLTYSNVMASIAVFAVLGGSAYAAKKIGSKQIRNNSVTTKDIKNGTVRGADLRVKQPRWLLIDEAGDIAEQSGGFSVVSKPGTNGQPATNPNVYVDTGDSLVDRGLNASIALQNLLDTSGDGTADPAFSGEASIARCGTDAVNCVPEGTNVDSVFAVRALADNTDVASAKRRVYVSIIP